MRQLRPGIEKLIIAIALINTFLAFSTEDLATLVVLGAITITAYTILFKWSRTWNKD